LLIFHSFLDIKSIKLNGKEAKWSLADRMEPYGSALSIKLEKGVEKGKDVEVDVCS
jgi:leukotriene-A4 hydrolase